MPVFSSALFDLALEMRLDIADQEVGHKLGSQSLLDINDIKSPAVCLPRRLALGRLGKFLDHPLALEPRDMVDEQHAVEMIDLVLQAGGKEPARLQLLLAAIDVEILDPHLRGPLD